MVVNVFLNDDECSCDNFDYHLSALKRALMDYVDRSPFSHVHVVVYKGGCHEETPQKACNEGVRKSRRNKAVINYACKPS